ncbi:Peptide chain release factor 1 [Psilocybe cubensis]|uniref:Peptide chain release factor 1 n=2 Tax=Psilocybe cubensis TaxID=181762 RepID=A0ACB8GLL1_PSICU|nr:Peptide chain release factor 1 [Psilocybe cubensis]KAH9475910.1 Peptide chain release factor 1 [Psilocybe cubensis]
MDLLFKYSQISEDVSLQDDKVVLRRFKELEPIEDAWNKWLSTRKELDDAIPMLADPDPSMASLADEEVSALTETLSTFLQSTFPSLLLPPSPTAHLSALMELKSGVGGSEASLFLGDLLRMYQRLVNNNTMGMNWTASVVAQNDAEGGGVKDATVEFRGEGAYDALRWESGVHRVQRVPATETAGRTHTSTVAVVVLPLVEESSPHDGEEELFTMDEIKLEVMRSRGAGGQHVNKTESAVRLTHIPTGITVSMQDQRSQHQNRRLAFQVLRSRLLDIKLQREMEARRDTRRSLVKGADRSEKIRTYNYAQGRVTDHRIGLTLKNLHSVLEGDGLHAFIEAVGRSYKEGLLADMLEEKEK